MKLILLFVKLPKYSHLFWKKPGGIKVKGYLLKEAWISKLKFVFLIYYQRSYSCKVPGISKIASTQGGPKTIFIK